MDRFGEKLRILRDREGISIRRLAEMLGYASHNHVSSIERGERKPSLELALQIADIFNVSIDQLARDELEV